MKKRYLILAGILAASMLAAGCGKKSSVAPEQKVEATVTPTVTEAAKSDVVEMQTSTDDTANIKNVMGTKSETTTSIVFTNKIDSTISAIYVRPTRDDGDDSDETWGSDLVMVSLHWLPMTRLFIIWKRVRKMTMVMQLQALMCV